MTMAQYRALVRRDQAAIHRASGDKMDVEGCGQDKNGQTEAIHGHDASASLCCKLQLRTSLQDIAHYSIS
jgi:hypothetical protein